MKPVIGIGWDVGGWQGSNHGWAACRWTSDNTVEWMGDPTTLRIPDGGRLELDDVIQRLTGCSLSSLQSERLVIAVDAPLSFPRAFKELLGGKSFDFVRPPREIDSRLAYRDTDRHVHAENGRKPLSAAFDRLGTNSTVAMVHIHHWKQQWQFSVARGASSGHGRWDIIEVYPALAKYKRDSNAALPGIAHLLPAEGQLNQDSFDAAICALHAVQFGADDRFEELPPLVRPDPDSDFVPWSRGTARRPPPRR